MNVSKSVLEKGKKKFFFSSSLEKLSFFFLLVLFSRFDFSPGRFACKRISKEKLRTEIDVEDVRREVEIMRCLPKHPNIVSFKEAFEDKDAVYLVMEICEGGELFDRIVSRGHYTERAAASVAKTILEVVKVKKKNVQSLLCRFFSAFFGFKSFYGL